MFTLSDVLAGTGGRLVAGGDSAAFRSVAIDSRKVGRGELFAAFRGQKHDGHGFVLQAFGHGAAGALVEYLPEDEQWTRPDWDGGPVVLVPSTGQALQDLARFWRDKHDVQVVGVTGSVGKTSTKELIAGLLSRQMSVLRTTANLNTEIGLPITLMQLDRVHRVAVLEMGMHDLGEIAQLADIAHPNIGVVTNVQHSHLQRLKSMERIAEAKSELVRALQPDGLAVLNYDDERVRAMKGLTPASTSYYGLTPDSEVRP
jgi:UDP-N-acetylmuramoyl-tripeptide--D-alanyl-D-alanine ligase